MKYVGVAQSLASILSMAAAKEQAKPRNYLNESIAFVVIAILLGAVLVSFRKAERESEKSQIIKKSDIQKQNKEKILDESDTSRVLHV